jgi:hypothetical protein
VVDPFRRIVHFITRAKIDCPSVAGAYLENVWNYHDIPEDAVSDWNRTFTGQCVMDMLNYMGLNRSMITAYHPESDRQRERINHVIEAFLEKYCNYEQDKCEEMPAMAEHAYNN